MEHLSSETPAGGSRSQGNMVLPRRALFMLVGLTVVLVIAVSVLATLFVSGGTANNPDIGVAAISSAASDASVSADEDTYGPTPTALSMSGTVLPGLLAAEGACDPLFGDADVDQVNLMARVELSELSSVLAVDGVDVDSIENLVSAGRGSEDQVLAVHRCVLDILEAPPGVLRRMEDTRAIDGTQSETWGKYKVTWTYHPDSGLDAVFSYVDLG